MSMDIMLKKVCTERTNTYLDLKGLNYPKWLEKYIPEQTALFWAKLKENGYTIRQNKIVKL